MTENYYKIFKSLKLNSTVAFGVNDSNSSGTSYLMYSRWCPSRRP